MKKNFLAFAALAVAFAGIFSCTKNPDEPSTAGKKITIKVTLPETRVAASVPSGGKGLEWAWESTDKLTVIGNTTETFTIKSFSGKEAEFEGNAVGGTSFTIIYPGTCTTSDQFDALDFNDQVQDGNGSTAHLKYIARLKNVDDYEEFEFNEEWATAHGGSFKENGAIRFEATLPDAITSVSALSAGVPGVSYAQVELSMQNVTIGNDHLLTAYASFPAGSLDLPANIPLRVSVTTGDGVLWTKDIVLTQASSFKAGMLNRVKLNAEGWETEAEPRYAGGSGIEGDPWLIATSEHMIHMNEDLTHGETKYFKLIDDIDMSGISDWQPSNVEPKPTDEEVDYNSFDKAIYFDGDNHTISNFELTGAEDYKYTSIFGILNGTVKNLNLNNCSLTTGINTPAGILAGWAGVSNASFGATVENVHATSCSVTSSVSGNNVGGLVGSANETTFKNCSFDGTVKRTSTGVEAGSYRYCGGLVGAVPNVGTVTFESCTTSGTLVNTSSSVGGILGGMNNSVTDIQFKDCSSTMDITCEGKVIGGIVGYVGGATITNCTYNGNITGTINGDGYIGGIAPYCNHWVEITGCTAKGTITAKTAKRVGGIFGSFASTTDDTKGLLIKDCVCSMTIEGGESTGGIIGITNTNGNGGERLISNCVFNGSITSHGQYTGGIAGYPCYVTIEKCLFNASISAGGTSAGGVAGRANSNDVINDCMVSGTITSTGQRVGGIVGNGGGGNLTIRRCFADCTVSTTNLGLGGVIGHATGGNSETNFAKQINVTVEKCVVWCPSIKASTGNITQWGGGAVIGASGKFNTLTDNYRRPDLVLDYNQAWDEDDDSSKWWPILYDQENTSASVALKFYDGSSDASASNWAQTHYHGKAAAAGKSAAQVATDLGWSTSVWDLSGSTPKIKNLPE
ncbi:MAG: hypothetical protein IJM35_05620 [Bacteroidales bacterium]|nr:hypothetical protein [Bacteroidales bacterium]